MFGAGAVLVLAAIGWIVARKVAGAVPAGALNPLSVDNIVYQGANATGAALTGDQDFSLGAWVWEATHPGAVAAENAALADPAAPAANWYESNGGGGRGW